MFQYSGGSEVIGLLPPARDVDLANSDTAKMKSDIVQILEKRFQWIERHLQEIEKDFEALQRNSARIIFAKFIDKTSIKELIRRTNKVRSMIDAIKDNFKNLNDKSGISLEDIQEFIKKSRESERRLQDVEEKLFQKI
jgi:uncharacterized protein (UPF0128 family)